MQLIIQPEAGIAPVVRAIRKAKTSLSICIFRIDRGEIEQALAAAVQRGVAVTALIAHTNRGGDNALRKLECQDDVLPLFCSISTKEQSACRLTSRASARSLVRILVSGVRHTDPHVKDGKIGSPRSARCCQLDHSWPLRSR